MNGGYAWFGRAAVALAVLLGVSACSTVVDGALGLMGIERMDRDAPPLPTMERRGLLASRRASSSFVSGYEVMPNRLLWNPSTGRLALNNGQFLGEERDGCDPVSQAVDGMLPGRWLLLTGLPVTTLGSMGVRGDGFPMILTGRVFGGYGLDRPDRMMRSPGRLPLMGTPACLLGATFDLRITWFGSTEPVVAR
jgi:hypothetical protein